MRTRLLTLLASAVALLACAGPASAEVTEFATGPGGSHWFAQQGLVGGSWIAGKGGGSGSDDSDDDEEEDDDGTVTPTATPTPGATAPVPAAVAPPAPAPPTLGRAVVIRSLSGSVRFRAPGRSAFAPVGSGARVPVGSLVDTRHGRISLQSARDAHGRTQTGTFWGAVFQVRHGRHSRGVTDLVLRGGSFARCGAVVAGASALAREAGGRQRAVRRLWGKDRHSRFRTHGRDSVATVRGTEWVTTDRCGGTLTKVRTGAVLVRDLHRKRSVLLTAGHAYFARHHRR